MICLQSFTSVRCWFNLHSHAKFVEPQCKIAISLQPLGTETLFCSAMVPKCTVCARHDTLTRCFCQFCDKIITVCRLRREQCWLPGARSCRSCFFRILHKTVLPYDAQTLIIGFVAEWVVPEPGFPTADQVDVWMSALLQIPSTGPEPLRLGERCLWKTVLRGPRGEESTGVVYYHGVIQHSEKMFGGKFYHVS